jgi:hypothetical protein
MDFIGELGAVPITQISQKDYRVILLNCPPRYAEPEEFLLNGEIKLLIQKLLQFLSNEDVREVIQTEISRYQPDYVLISIDEMTGREKEAKGRTLVGVKYVHEKPK